MKPELTRPLNMGLSILISKRLTEPFSLHAAELTQMREMIEDRIVRVATGLANYVSIPGGWTEPEMVEQHAMGAVIDLILERSGARGVTTSLLQGSKKVTNSLNGYDVVGDIHGHSEQLEALLQKMGYQPKGRGYLPPQGRRLVLLGDLIDRGPTQLRVLEIARSMVDAGHARCIMGNHEFNAICYATPSKTDPDEQVRPNRRNSDVARKNREQHAEFLAQVGEGNAQHLAWVEWFKKLPPFLDLGGIRVVHGCWDQEAVEVLAARGWVDGQRLDGDLLFDACDPQSRTKWARELLTCGLEIALPAGRFIVDKAGHRHPDVRVANWRHWAKEFHEVALVPRGQEQLLAGMEWPTELVISAIQGSPIFVGHHWFSGHPTIESPKLACLDWSVAKGGHLVGYRWSGETELSDEGLVWV